MNAGDEVDVGGKALLAIAAEIAVGNVVSRSRRTPRVGGPRRGLRNRRDGQDHHQDKSDGNGLHGRRLHQHREVSRPGAGREAGVSRRAVAAV